MDKERPPPAEPPPSYEEVSRWSHDEHQYAAEEHHGKKVHFGSQLPIGHQPQQHAYQYHYPSTLQEPPLHYHNIEGVNISPSHQTYGYYGYPPHQRIVIEPPPPNHALLAWLTCLCCCWPIGVIAVIKSLDVNSAVQRGDMVRAKESSRKAKKYAMTALGCGIFFSLLWLIIWIFIARHIQTHPHFRYTHYF